MSVKFDKCMCNALYRIVIFAMLIASTAMVYNYRNEIQNYAKQYITDNESATVYQGKIQNMDDILNGYMNRSSDVQAISVYKFIPNSQSALYKGQSNILTTTRGNGVSEDWKPEVRSVDSTAQDVLFNKVHYEAITSVKVVCDKIYNVKSVFSCEKYKVISKDFKSIITIPVMDARSYSVTGYIMVVLEDEYNTSQIQNIVSDMRPYIEKIQPIVNSISKDDIPIK